MSVYLKFCFFSISIVTVLIYKDYLWQIIVKKEVPFNMHQSTNAPLKRYIGGYYWSGTVKGTKPEDLNANLLTHLYYAFLIVNDDGTLTLQQEDKGLAEGMVKLKDTNPDLKLLFSVANQNESFSKVVADEAIREKLVQNFLDVVQKYNYDGIDLDWEFPQDKDKENYISLLRETKAKFKKYNYLLTAAVRAIPIYKDTGYIVPEMVKYLDIINIMTYDFYGAWSATTGQNSPLYPYPSDSDYEKKYLNIEAAIKNWVEAGAPKNILAMGLPFYGRTFILKDPAEHGVHAPSLGGGTPLAPTYRQILKNYQNYTTEWNEEQKSPYKYFETTWLGYEDERSIEIKVKHAAENKLLGVFVWQLGGDDVEGEFAKQKQPLLQKINDVYTASFVEQ